MPFLNEKYWEAFYQRELKNYNLLTHKYEKKGYLHFDRRIWFPDYAAKFRALICDPSQVAAFAFKPFLHVTIHTRRFRYDEEKQCRAIQLKPRPISYAAHFDALALSFYNTILTHWYESYVVEHGLSQCVLAYRQLGFSNIHFAKEVFGHISERGECVALAIDVSGFFDSLNHRHLKKTWIEVLRQDPDFTDALLPSDHFNLFKSLTRYAYIPKSDAQCALNIADEELGSLHQLCNEQDFRQKIRPLIQLNKASFGIPQGTPISAVLSNIYMTGFDRAMCKAASRLGAHYRRYCDDILVVCNKEQLPGLKLEIEMLLKGLNLEINEKKTETVYFRKDTNGNFRGVDWNAPHKFKNLQYLGFEFSGQKVYIRSASVSRYYRRMKSAVHETVKRTYGRNSKGKVVGRKKLYDRHIVDTESNFPGYARRADNEFANNGNAFSEQLRNSRTILKKAITEKSEKRKAFVQYKEGLK